MKRIILILLTIICSYQLLALDLTPDETAWLKEHPVIRIAPDPEFPPIEWFDVNGVYRGITADFMKLIASALDIEFEVIHCESWDEVLHKAKAREVDLLPAAAQTTNRAEYMLFSDPYLVFPGVIITTKSNRNLNSTRELYHKEVGIVSGYVWQEFISNDHPQINIVNVANITDGLRKVSTNEIDAFIATLPIALYYIEQEGIHNLVVAGETDYQTKLSIQTRKDWPLLNSIITKTLKAIPLGKKKEIINKWISLKPMSIFSYKVFWIVILSIFVVSFLIVIVIFTWNVSLKKQVRIRTRELQEDIAKRKVTEEELSKFARQWQITFDATNEAIWTLDKDHVILLCNESSKKMFNKTTDEIIGKKCWEIVHDTSQPVDECPCLKAKQGFKRETMVLQVEDKWLLITVDPIIDEEGNFSGAVHIISDNTDRKVHEEKIKFLSSVVEQSAEGMAIADLDGKLLFVNDAWVNMHNYKSAEELLGQNLTISHNKKQLLEEVEPFNKKVLENGFNTGEVGHIKKDGTIFQTYMSTTLLKNEQGIPIAIAAVATDITEQKKMETELEKHREHLEELVKERTAELEEYNKLFIGREFRVKELREKVKELEAKLEIE